MSAYDDRRDDRGPPPRDDGPSGGPNGGPSSSSSSSSSTSSGPGNGGPSSRGPVKHYVSREAHNRKVFLGGLDERTTKADVEEFLAKAGPLVSVWVARSPPGFAFVEFEDARDAADACRDLDGRTLRGKPVKVEISSGGTKRPKPGHGDRRYDDHRGGGGGPPRVTECYVCHGTGHFARNCPHSRDGGGRGRSRSPARRYDDRYDDRRYDAPRGGYDDRRPPYDDRRPLPLRPRSRSPPRYAGGGADRRRSPSPVHGGGRRRTPSPRRRTPSPRRDGPPSNSSSSKDDIPRGAPRSPSPKRD